MKKACILTGSLVASIQLALVGCGSPLGDGTGEDRQVMDTLNQSPEAGARASGNALWYTARCYPLCDDEKGIVLSTEKLTAHGTRTTYDTVQSVTQDSAIIRFDFITDCCLEFIGDVGIKDDTLMLAYGGEGGIVQPCDCYCDYRMVYRIDRSGRHWNAIRIISGRLH